MDEIRGGAVLAVSAGILFVWSGIKGWSILAVVGDVITGKKPAQANTYPLYAVDDTPDGVGGGPSTRSAGALDTSSLAATALQYVGHAYRYGGAPGANAQNPWDCSSMVNWVVGVAHGKAIPGNGPGKYNGSTHGPPTGTWGVWPGLQRLSRSDVQAGDIIVWVGHMGIAISNTDYVSALNPKTTTKVRPIDGGSSGPLMIYGRLKN